MKAIIGLMAGLPQTRARRDDDFSDRLSYRYTVSILLTFAVVVTTKQYVGGRITCWVPAHFSGEWEEYTNAYCWVKNTYYLPLEENIPREHEHGRRDFITYYQWVPLILLMQALFYYMPAMVWHSLNDRSGVDINSLVVTALTFHQAEKVADRENNLRCLNRQMHRFVTNRKRKANECEFSLSYVFARFLCRKCGRQNGNYLNSLYIFIKVLYIVNAIGQIFLMDFFLGNNFHLYGIDALNLWARGEDIAGSARFPRVTMCDFKVRWLGNVQRHTVQCVLPINLFHENVYLIVWFWMVFVALYSVYSLMVWFSQSLFRIDRHRFIKKNLLPEVRAEVKKNKQALYDFVAHYLGPDGVFVLRLIMANTDIIATQDITTSLWDNYQKQKQGIALDGPTTDTSSV